MKRLLALFLTVAMLTLAVGCSLPACPHLDGDSDGRCDLCTSDMTEKGPGGGDNPHTVHTTTKQLVCSVCGEKVPYHVEGEYVYMGEYPQSLKDEGVSITETVDSRGYYLGSDGYYYAKRTSEIKSDETHDYHFNNGEAINRSVDYYFKVEPMRWRIFSTEDDGSVRLVSDSVIDRKRHTMPSVADSVWSWLVGEFKSVAFTEEQVGLMVEREGYAMISLVEAFNASVVGARCTTDYARITGSFSIKNTTYGNLKWWLKDPSPTDSSRQCVVDENGKIDSVPNGNAMGVVASIFVNLGGIE